MLRKSLLLALLATTLPAQSALIDLRADYSISQPGSPAPRNAPAMKGLSSGMFANTTSLAAPNPLFFFVA